MGSVRIVGKELGGLARGLGEPHPNIVHFNFKIGTWWKKFYWFSGEYLLQLLQFITIIKIMPFLHVTHTYNVQQ